MNPFSNQGQYARQYSNDSDAESYTSRNASSVPLATSSGYYDGTYTPQCESPLLSANTASSAFGRSPAPICITTR